MTAVTTPTATGTTNAGWAERYDAAVAGVLPNYFAITAATAEGSWITDVEGRRFLDFGSGIAVTNVGHRHPRVVAALHAQVDEILHTSVVLRHRPYVELAEAIGRLAPWFVDPRVFLCNSGAEAVDGAIKLARLTTGRPGIIGFLRAFHGRTLGATSLTTAKARYRQGYDPLVPAVHHAPYGNVPGALDTLDELLAHQVAPESVAAIVVEPVLGEGGYVVPPVEWLAGLRERCDRHGILLVFDEVQTGFGRTGRPFAAETLGVFPDVLLFAKGVASGLPLGGIVAGAALMDRWPNGAHGSTFGGNPVSCAAAVATIAVLEDERLFDRARDLGQVAVARLQAAVVGSAAVRDVRGLGLMIGVELADGPTAEAVQQRCLDAGLIVLTCGPHSEVLRLVPPLTITDAELEHGLTVLLDALAEV
jgi:4-aminobutyrate aminotransferase